MGPELFLNGPLFYRRFRGPYDLPWIIWDSRVLAARSRTAPELKYSQQLRTKISEGPSAQTRSTKLEPEEQDFAVHFPIYLYFFLSLSLSLHLSM